MGKPNRQRNDEEWQAKLRQVLLLAPGDQLKLYIGLGDDLAGGLGPVSKRDTEARAQLAGLASMRVAAEYLGLPDSDPPSTTQYQRAESETTLPLKFGVVYDAFEHRWHNAHRAYRGERAPATATQRALRRKTLGSARSPYEHPMTCVRQFVNQDPPPDSDTEDDYNSWAKIENESRGPTEPLLHERASYLGQMLRVGWRLALAVARNEKTLDQAQKERLAEALRHSGPLVGASVAGLILGKVAMNVKNYSRRSDFPRQVAVIGRGAVWRRADIEAYKLGKREFSHAENLLQSEILSSKDIAALVGVRVDRVWPLKHQHRWDRLPRPAGNAGMVLYWFRADVERWLGAWVAIGSPGG